jgi:hypothetical protein
MHMHIMVKCMMWMLDSAEVVAALLICQRCKFGQEVRMLSSARAESARRGRTRKLQNEKGKCPHRSS